MEGGDLFDKGGYSCVFHPLLHCARGTAKGVHTSSTHRMLSKVMLTEDAELEWNVTKIIRQTPRCKRYMAVAEIMCGLDQRHKQTDVFKKCEQFQHIPAQQMRILQLPYAGVPMSSYSFGPQFDLRTFMIHLLECGTLLSLLHIVHLDLHEYNILIDDAGIPRVIDFNLSINQSALQHKPKKEIEMELVFEYQHNYHFIQQPPDYSAVVGFYQYNKSDSPQYIRESIHSKENLSLARMVFEEPSYGSLKHIQALERHPEIKQGDVITWFNTYWKTIDSWAIGMYFIKLLHTHQTTPHIINQYLKSDEIRKMVRGLCIIDPKKRWTCMQALYYLHPNSPMITDRKLIRAHHKKMTSASV